MSPQDLHGAAAVGTASAPVEPKARPVPLGSAVRLAVDLAAEDMRVAAPVLGHPRSRSDARVLAVCGSSAALLPLRAAGAGVEHLDPAAVESVPDQAGWPAAEGVHDACLLLDMLDRAPDPGAALAAAYKALRPGAMLALTVDDTRRKRERSKRTSGLRRGTDRNAFPGDTLQNLFFREGFEAPRLRRAGGRLVVTARRSPLAPPAQRDLRLSVVMPVFNEFGTFRKAIDTVLGKKIPGLDIGVIVVESNSTDGTREEAMSYAAHPRVDVVLEERPQGKGHAVRVGLARATGDFILIQDADLEYDVDDYDRLLEPLRRCEAGFVLGYRVNPDGHWGMRQFGPWNLVSRMMNLGHVMFLTLFNTVYRQRLRDPFTMYKVFRRDCLHGLTFECNRFDFDWELTAKLIRAGYAPVELPARYHSRSFAEGKKVSFFGDPWTWVVACFKYRFVRLYR